MTTGSLLSSSSGSRTTRPEKRKEKSEPISLVRSGENKESYSTFKDDNLIHRPPRSIGGKKKFDATKFLGSTQMEMVESTQKRREARNRTSEDCLGDNDLVLDGTSSQLANEESFPSRTIDEYLQNAVDEAAMSRNYPWQYWFMFLSMGVANSSDATEILCLSYILADEKFKNTVLMESGGGNLAAAVFLGMLIGGLWVGTAGDVYGRRPILLMGCFVNSAAGILASSSTHLIFLTVCRLVAGLGIGATVPPLFTLCSELAPPSQRGFWVAVVASFWMVGSLFVAVIGYVLFTNPLDGIPAWRIFLLICALPSLMGGLLVLINVPESPRFLALQGQHNNAARAAQALGHKLLSLVRPWSVRESEAQFSRPTLHRAHESGTTSPHWKRALIELYRSTRVLYTNDLCNSMVGLQIVWGSLSFGSYGLATWINSLFEQVHLQNIYFNAILFALSNLPGNLSTAYFLDSLGRQNMLTGSLLAASISLGTFGFAAAMDEDTEHRDVVIVAAACAFQAFTIAAWNTIDVLTAEVFPTSVRSTAMGLCAATGRLAAMFAQVVNGALIAQPARLLATSALSLAIGATVPHCLIPDRTGMAVLDRAADGDSPCLSEESSEFLPESKDEMYHRVSEDSFA